MGPILVTILIFGISLGIGIPWGLSLRNKQNTLVGSGNMVKRPYNFFKQRNVFHTSVADAGQIMNVLDSQLLNSQGIAFEYRPQNGMIVFANNAFGGTFVSSLNPLGYNETIGAYLYEYQLRKWTNARTSSIKPADMIGANIVLTALEQAFLKLDYNAVVERTFGEFKSKTSFI